jgi:hypothetical protein
MVIRLETQHEQVAQSVIVKQKASNGLAVGQVFVTIHPAVPSFASIGATKGDFIDRYE